MTEEEMPLLDHLEELRSRLIKALLGVTVGLCVCYFWGDPLMAYLQRPLLEQLPAGQQRLYFTNPMEKFVIYLKLSTIAGIALSFPWILYQIWAFVAPGLKPKERRFAAPLIVCGSILFLLGCAFAFTIVIPLGLKYLLSFGGSFEGAIITYTAYFDSLFLMMLVFGVVFQVPLFIILGVKVGIINREALVKKRPYIYVAMSVIAAIFTPPDPISMMAMFIPMVILYEASVLSLKWIK
jgi:sec-independent protein translocase protein TatC